jgi:hypothetical protein
MKQIEINVREKKYDRFFNDFGILSIQDAAKIEKVTFRIKIMSVVTDAKNKR